MIDASTAVYAALTDDGFVRLRRFELLAPPLLWSEALSAIREHAWRGDISTEQADASRDALLQAHVARRVPRGLYAEAWRVAAELGWAKTYDAEYVALARILRCQLLTRDGRLRRGAARMAEVIGPIELPAG